VAPLEIAHTSVTGVILELWNIVAKHDSMFQKSPILSLGICRCPAKQGNFLQVVCQKPVNSRHKDFTDKVPELHAGGRDEGAGVLSNSHSQ
jgi:hypothetical protein